MKTKIAITIGSVGNQASSKQRLIGGRRMAKLRNGGMKQNAKIEATKKTDCQHTTY